MTRLDHSERTYPRIMMIPPGPKAREIIRMDAQLLSQATRHLYPLVVDSAKGCIVTDVDGNEFIDFSSASGVANTGHNHPRILDAVKAQLDKALGLGYGAGYREDVVRISDALARITPGEKEKVICYCTSGSEAVEAGIKAAAWHTRGDVFFSFTGAFHGRTLGALSLSSSNSVHKRYFPAATRVVKFTYPYCFRCPLGQEYPNCNCCCIDAVEDCLKRDVPPEEVACMVVEPIQGEGCIVPPPDFFEKLMRLARKHGLLLLDDEVLAGIGRTGRWFAIENWKVSPDLISVGGSLSSGLPIGAVIGRQDVMDWEPDTHSSSLGGNPLACVSAMATIETIREEHLLENAVKEGNHILNRLQETAEKHPIVGDVRGKGLLIGVEIVKDSKLREPDYEAARQIMLKCWRRGILIQTVGESTLRLCPPLVIDRDLVDTTLDILESTIHEKSSEV